MQEGTQPVPRFLEIAWDGRGRWAGAGPRPHYPRPPLDIPHQCGVRYAELQQERHREPDCGIFVCVTCRRVVPWCFGGSGPKLLDDHICDECWCFAEDAAEQAHPAAAHPFVSAPSQAVAS